MMRITIIKGNEKRVIKKVVRMISYMNDYISIRDEHGTMYEENNFDHIEVEIER